MNIGAFPARRLKTRLIFWTAAIVIVAVWGSFEVRTRIAASMLERDLEERASTMIATAIRTFDLSGGSLDPATLASRLQDFVDADPAMSRIDVVRAGAGTPELVASTLEAIEPAVDRLPSGTENRIVRNGGVRELITIEPVEGTGYWVVGVTSLAGLDRYVAGNRAWAAVFSAGVIVAVVLLMSLLFDRLVSRRFDRLIRALASTGEEPLSELLAGEPADEIGMLAGVFDDLLSQVRAVNENLRTQVDEATRSLNKRNRRLEETMRQLIAAQRQVLRSERLATVGQMAATFAHDIGSPLSSLSAHVQLLLEERNLPGDQRETLGVVRDQIDSLVQIVNDMLRAARHGPEDFVEVHVEEIVEQVQRLVEPKFRSQQIELRSKLRPVPPIRGYPLYLQEALLNLANNAFDAMPDGGQLQFDLWHDEAGNKVRLRIADTGSGIDPEVVERVFDGFVTTKDLGSGTGLGLAIVREIVTSHGGAIELSSPNGRGTTVELSFPPLAGEQSYGLAANTGR